MRFESFELPSCFQTEMESEGNIMTYEMRAYFLRVKLSRFVVNGRLSKS